MTTRRFKTAVIGFGKMGAGYAADPAMARYYPYATHAQVLADHERFEWIAVVDPNPDAQDAARRQWSVENVAATVTDLGDIAEEIEVAILATPPDSRLAILDGLPNLRAVLVEKPLGLDVDQANLFLDECRQRGILVQVNIWRRADEMFRRLAAGLLSDRIGRVQVASFFYGNGLLNNGTHMVDFARMLFGEVKSVQRINVFQSFVEGPIAGDSNQAFAVEFVDGGSASFLPLRFSAYRENGVIIWGARGRFDILNEGLVLACYPQRSNRAMTGEREVAADAAELMPSTVGKALYEMYTNLSQALSGTADLVSSGVSALLTSQLIECIRSAPASGEQTIVPIHNYNAR